MLILYKYQNDHSYAPGQSVGRLPASLLHVHHSEQSIPEYAVDQDLRMPTLSSMVWHGMSENDVPDIRKRSYL